MITDWKCECGSVHVGITPVQSTIGQVAYKPLLVGLMLCAECGKPYIYRPAPDGSRKIYPAGCQSAKRMVIEAELEALESKDF